MVTRIQDIEDIFKEIFNENDGKVSTVDTLYELSDDESFYKLVITLNNISFDDSLIIHTKFIFKTDLEKANLIEESFIYLYDINCIYRDVNFTNVVVLKHKILDILENNKFGTNLQIISDFATSPASFINHYLRKSDITEYSVFDVKYDPKFKHIPCNRMSFDFIVNVNNQYNFSVTIKKEDATEENEIDRYIFKFKFMDTIETVEEDSMKNIHYIIGSNIAKILDEKMK